MVDSLHDMAHPLAAGNVASGRQAADHVVVEERTNPKMCIAAGSDQAAAALEATLVRLEKLVRETGGLLP